ncbi:MAG: hypothetical protein RBT49_11825 [Bacteroidales bacterium]|jgi:mannose/fructose/N-acetylgalactosamine-specific phosphotransferase system component IID|nr:hypothetical protein [Bacteroidales bacterium]
MAIIYQDTTQAYQTSTTAIGGASKGIAQNFADGFNAVGNFVIGTLATILPFESLTRLKNERLANEQNANLTADQIQTKADQNITIAVVVIIVIVAVVFIVIKKKKS